MAKGGAYEWTIIRKLVASFKPFGIHPDDAYRSRGSGAHDQPGDIALSPAFAKLFPVSVECKHYKNVKYQLGKLLDHQDKSFHLWKWWKQVRREQKQNPKRYAVLVFRQNRCPDLIALKVEHFQALTGKLPKWEMFGWCMFTRWGASTVVIIHLDEFLQLVVSKIKETRIIGKKGKRNVAKNK